MPEDILSSRRGFLVWSGTACAGLFLSGCSRSKDEGSRDAGHSRKAVLSEDILCEHGVLQRSILIMEASVRRLDAHMGLPPEALPGAVEIIQTYLEDFHQRKEEEEIFPYFEKAGKFNELIAVLRNQHQAGRRMTEIIQNLAASAIRDSEKRRKLDIAVNRFAYMYRVHTSREDTVLFPALYQVVGPREYEKIAEDCRKRQQQLLGENAFARVIEKTLEIEELLSIQDLETSTPDF